MAFYVAKYFTLLFLLSECTVLLSFYVFVGSVHIIEAK